MTKRLALGRVPAIVFLLTLSSLATPAAAQVAVIAATPVAVTATPVSDAKPVASTPLLQVTPAPAATILQPVTTVPKSAPTVPQVSATIPQAATNVPQAAVTALSAIAPGRAAILSPAPRASAGTTPPSGTTAVRPAVTHAGLWPMVWTKMNTAAAQLNEQEECIAIAVYHEARGEPLSGQLAVAEVIMNRAASGRYPAGWCEVVKQPWQFSFVNPRTGRIPAVNRDSASWAYAQAITRIAVGHYADALPGDVLWYHADYVAPSWGRRLAKVEKIGAHIFYRAS